VVLNLLGNALKFTFHGDIRLICTLTEHNTVQIAVTDTGIGIPEGKIARLCKAFEKVEGTQRINPQGCGLGLYISNLLAISLGAKRISIHSKQQAGSQFSFEIQIYQQEIEESEHSFLMDAELYVEDERRTEATISPSLCAEKQLGARHYPTILVVDDSEFNRLVLIKLLESMNTAADQASSGLRAVSLIRSKAAKFHYYRLILMDMEMPEMDGVTATQEIRTMEVTGELQVRARIACCSADRGKKISIEAWRQGWTTILRSRLIERSCKRCCYQCSLCVISRI
jgi:CheY-like chemotaxis protein